jgi:hypothetical protein
LNGKLIKIRIISPTTVRIWLDLNKSLREGSNRLSGELELINRISSITEQPTDKVYNPS